MLGFTNEILRNKEINWVCNFVKPTDFRRLPAIEKKIKQTILDIILFN